MNAGALLLSHQFSFLLLIGGKKGVSNLWQTSCLTSTSLISILYRDRNAANKQAKNRARQFMKRLFVRKKNVEIKECAAAKGIRKTMTQTDRLKN